MAQGGEGRAPGLSTIRMSQKDGETLTTVLAEGQAQPQEASKRAHLASTTGMGHRWEGTHALASPGTTAWHEDLRTHPTPNGSSPAPHHTLEPSRNPTLQEACRDLGCPLLTPPGCVKGGRLVHPARAQAQIGLSGGQGPPTSWWMLSMARLYLSQSLCMLSKLKGKGKAPVTAELRRSQEGLASLSGGTAHRQAEPALPW